VVLVVEVVLEILVVEVQDLEILHHHLHHKVIMVEREILVDLD
jgi:hypothetical protein